MAHFTQIQTIAFLQASPQAPDKFFQDKLNESGKVKSKALGCPRGGDLNYYIEQADEHTGFAVLVPTAADALLLADPNVPAQATLDNWQKELRVLFTVAGRNPSRVCLLPLRNAARSPAAAMAAIGVYFHLDLPVLAAQEPVVLNMPADPLDRLIAHVSASDNKSVARADARLLAKSLALPSDIPSVTDLLAKVAEQSKATQGALQQLEQAKAELADRDAALQTAHAEAKTLQADVDQAKAELADRDTALQTAHAEAKTLQADVDQAKAELADRDTALQTAHAEAKTLQADVDQAKAELANRDTALQTAHAEAKTLQADADRAKADLADRVQRVSEYALRMAERDEELHATRQEVTALANHIELIRTSTSWRITGPMRRFRRLFRRS